MAIIFSRFYDSIMAASEEACLADWRRELIQDLSGDILEIGSGTGANISYFSNKITSMVLSEPDISMRKLLAEKASKYDHHKIRISSSTAENIDATFIALHGGYGENGQLQTLLELAEIPLSEIKRVLKPGGSLVFMEHVAAEQGTRRRVWQHRINPFWKRLAGNCHLIRETESDIQKAGFEITNITRESMRKALPIVRPTIRGVAKKP